MPLQPPVDASPSLPPGAVDCHVHVFDPTRFPYAADRRYTPAPANVEELLRLHDALGIRRTVLVQPSVYKTDNRCLVDALARLGDRARGVAVVAESVSSQELADLWGAGVRGVRLNFRVNHQSDPARLLGGLERVARALASTPMLLQVFADTRALLACGTLLRDIPNQIVVDHFGTVSASEGPEQDVLAELSDLLSCGHVWMKLSAPYQISTAPGYADVPPIARHFMRAHPHRTVWGSDWPHTGGVHRLASRDPREVEPFRVEDEVANLNLVIDGLTATQEHALLVDNPARLFGFPAAGRA